MLTTSSCDGSREITDSGSPFLDQWLQEVREAIGQQTQETPAPSPTVAGPAPNPDPPSQALDTIALVLIGAIAVVALSAGAAAVWRGTRG